MTTTHPERAAFEAAVAADPGDDTCRLAFADWLDEHGDELFARFIRRQIAGEVAAVPLTVLLPLEPALGCRPHECQRGAEAGVAFARTPAGVVFWFRRGFVEAVRCTGDYWESNGDRLCERQPVRRVAFAGAAPAVENTEELKHPDGGRVWRYRVAGRDADLHERSVVAAGSPENVARLVLSARWPRVPPEGWAFPPPQSGVYTDGYFTAVTTTNQPAPTVDAILEAARVARELFDRRRAEMREELRRWLAERFGLPPAAGQPPSGG